MEPSLKQAQAFLGCKLPEELSKKHSSSKIYKMLDQKEIQKYIDFNPPFLKADKIIVFYDENGSLEESSSIAVGKITLKQTEGHYNSTIYLALGGFLMASLASVHIGILFPDTAPQAFEGNKVCLMPGEILNKGILKPSKSGTTFYVHTTLIKKKLKLQIADVSMYVGRIPYGMVESLKVILTEKNSIYSAIEIPEVI